MKPTFMILYAKIFSEKTFNRLISKTQSFLLKTVLKKIVFSSTEKYIK